MTKMLANLLAFPGRNQWSSWNMLALLLVILLADLPVKLVMCICLSDLNQVSTDTTRSHAVNPFMHSVGETFQDSRHLICREPLEYNASGFAMRPVSDRFAIQNKTETLPLPNQIRWTTSGILFNS